MKKKLLRLPIELYQRECLDKLYLSLRAAKRGYQSFIYYHNNEAVDDIGGGFYLYKDHACWNIPRFKNKKKRGMYLGAFDEEGFIYDEHVYARTRGSSYLLDNLDAVFMWGEAQRNTISRLTNRKDNKYISGAVKFDIYNLIRRQRKYSSSPPRKILINTRFSHVNGIRKGGEGKLMKKLGFVSSEEEETSYLTFLASEKLIFNEFEKLIYFLASDNRFSLVIRPHPAEDVNIYKAYENLGCNVVVDNKAILASQLQECDILIHDGCTTAVEARAMGVPCLGLRPHGLKASYNDYANQFSHNFSSAEDVFNFLRKEHLTIEKIPQPEVDSLASYKIHNWTEVAAADRIIDVIDCFPLAKQNIVTPSAKINFYALFKRKKIVYLLATKIRFFYYFLKKALGEERVANFILEKEVENTKCPPFSLVDIEEKINFLLELDPSLGSRDDYQFFLVNDKGLIFFKK
ncbi:MAG: surface carbohydrate biosynthesis protein [Halomonadaceae bacterium]|jgi:surface carbohydrate biosynthesis protein